jgi:hypothetical protein
MEAGLARSRWCGQRRRGRIVRKSIQPRKAILAVVLLPSLVQIFLLALRTFFLPAGSDGAALLFPRPCLAHRRNQHVEGKLALEYLPPDPSQLIDGVALPAPESSCSSPRSQRRHRVCTLHHRSPALAADRQCHLPRCRRCSREGGVQ